MGADGEESAQAAGGKQRRTGLGRGLGSLIPTSPVFETAHPPLADAPVLELPVDRISANPYQPRSVMDEAKLDELAESIRTHGVVQPLIVTKRPTGDDWWLIAGERRWRASRRAGLERVPVVVREATPQAMLELAIIENVVRADLGPLEEATAFRQLMDDFGLTQADVASRVGRSRTAVANTLRLLGAPEQVQQSLAEGTITEGHARAILGLSTTADQITALNLVVQDGLNVRQTEALVRNWGQTAAKKPTTTDRNPDEVRIEDRLRSALGTRVALKKGASGRGGSLTIEFFSDEHLNTIYDRLVGEDVW